MRRFRLFGVGVVMAALLASHSASAELDAAAADALVDAQWFEGMPAHKVEPLSAAAVDHLGAALEDETQVQRHAAILELLGRCDGPGAYEAVARFAQAPAPASGERSGERSRDLGRAALQAQLAVPIALGHLAKRHPQAMEALQAHATRRGPAGFRSGRLSEDRVGRLLRQSAASGLVLATQPEEK